MRNIKLLALALSAALATGCNSKQVQEYAKRLDALLADYRAGVQGRIDAERRMYDQISAVFATEAEREVYEGLKIERLRQQRIVTADLITGRLDPSQVQEKMRETSVAEFDRTRAWFEQELTVKQQYQAGLARVALDVKKLDALDAALKAVESSTDLKTALKDVVTLGSAFKTEFDLQQCKDLERELSITAESVSTLSEEKPDTQAEVDALNQHIGGLKASQAVVQAKLDANPNYKAVAGDPTKKKCQ